MCYVVKDRTCNDYHDLITLLFCNAVALCCKMHASSVTDRYVIRTHGEHQQTQLMSETGPGRNTLKLALVSHACSNDKDKLHFMSTYTFLLRTIPGKQVLAIVQGSCYQKPLLQLP